MNDCAGSVLDGHRKQRHGDPFADADRPSRVPPARAGADLRGEGKKLVGGVSLAETTTTTSKPTAVANLPAQRECGDVCHR